MNLSSSNLQVYQAGYLVFTLKLNFFKLTRQIVGINFIIPIISGRQKFIHLFLNQTNF